MEPVKSTETNNSPETKQAIFKDVHARWNKFSEQEISAFKSKDDLVTQIASKYSQDRIQVQRDVDGVLKGRSF